MRKIQILDTTLRDGEQTPGVNFNTKEKVQIALELQSWGVDVIEAGFPISSTGDFEAVKAIANTVDSSTVAGLARCNEKDIDAATEAIKGAKDSQIHIFLATSPVHMEYKLKMTPDQVLESIEHHTKYTRNLVGKVQFSPEDATRTDKEFLREAVQTAIKAGATVINIPDTVGYSNPTEYGELFKYIIANTDSDGISFSSHCHNDLGLAVANALAAIENGSNRVEGAINGIGERAGNCALEEIAVGLHIRKDFYNCETNIDLGKTKALSNLVADLSGITPQKNKAIVGANAFSHESGIHQDGVLKNPTTYEIITPQLVGVDENSLPLGKLSGKHAFKTKLQALGFKLNDDQVLEAFKEFKHLADKKKYVLDNDIKAIVLGDNLEFAGDYLLEKLLLAYTAGGEQAAIVSVKFPDGSVQNKTAFGKGSVEAIFNAIDKLFDIDTQLLNYGLEAVTSGIESQAEVYVNLSDPGADKGYNAIGIDYDVLFASAKAYLQAYSQVVRHCEA
jgi:2-isopropylmalate synthase